MKPHALPTLPGFFLAFWVTIIVTAQAAPAEAPVEHGRRNEVKADPLSKLPPIAPSVDYHAIVDAFVHRIAKGQPGSAAQDIYNTSPYTADKPDEGLKFGAEFQKVADDEGRYIGWELLQDTLVTPRLAYVYGILYFDKDALRIELMLYCGKEGKWFLKNINYSDGENLREEIRRMAKSPVALKPSTSSAPSPSASSSSGR